MRLNNFFKCLLVFVFFLLKTVHTLCSFFYLYVNTGLIICMLRTLTLYLDIQIAILFPNSSPPFHSVSFSFCSFHLFKLKHTEAKDFCSQTCESFVAFAFGLMLKIAFPTPRFTDAH